jgi:hypothetical protein
MFASVLDLFIVNLFVTQVWGFNAGHLGLDPDYLPVYLPGPAHDRRRRRPVDARLHRGRGQRRRPSPAVGLSYDSRAGNGPVGVGWSLAGVASQVAPCRRSFNLDGVPEGVRFNGSSRAVTGRTPRSRRR